MWKINLRDVLAWPTDHENEISETVPCQDVPFGILPFERTIHSTASAIARATTTEVSSNSALARPFASLKSPPHRPDLHHLI